MLHLVLLATLQFTPVNCKEPVDFHLVLLIQFASKNCEKKKVSFGPIFTAYNCHMYTM